MDDRFFEAIAALIAVFSVTKDPWCIIADAATAIHTGDWSGVHDIDVVVSVADARRLAATGGFVDRTDGGSGTYKSKIYATRPGDVEIEIFADF